MDGRMPKRLTQAFEFLEKYPEFDGTGIRVAVVDTGVDPSAEGLVVNPNGSRKFFDFIDSTGSGDVDTSVVADIDESSMVVGLSGRHLKIPESWDIPNGN
eukprot:266343_1